MPAALTLYPPRRAPRFLVLRDGDTLEIGRHPSCGLVLQDHRVSKRHASLRGHDSTWTLHDLGSKNGTTVNGGPALGTELQDGDWISFGGLPARFERLTAVQMARLDTERLVRLHTLATMRRCLVPGLQPLDLVLRFLESAMELTGADRGFVVALTPDGTLHPEVARGFSIRDLWDERFRGSALALRDVLEGGGVVAVSDALADPRLGTRPSVVLQGISSVVCLPLRVGHTILGALYMDSRRSRDPFTALDLEALESLSDHASRVFARALEGAGGRYGATRPENGGFLQELGKRLRDLQPIPERA